MPICRDTVCHNLLAPGLLALDMVGERACDHKIRKILALRRRLDTFSPVASATAVRHSQDAINGWIRCDRLS